jgi:hypothetical protein
MNSWLRNLHANSMMPVAPTEKLHFHYCNNDISFIIDAHGKDPFLKGTYNIRLDIGALENRKWHIKYIGGWFNPPSC